MHTMHYDPIKDTLNKLLQGTPCINRFTRKAFYICLDLFILRQWYVKRAIKRYLKRDATPCIFYDAGAGFCQYSDFVLNRYKSVKVLAVDLKTDFLSGFSDSLKDTVGTHLCCPKKERFHYLNKNLEDFAIDDTLFDHRLADMIIAIDILEHIENDLIALKNFYRSLNENGYLIISTPSSQSLKASFTAEHVRSGYSIDELQTKVHSVGFEVVSCQYTYGFFGNIHWCLVMRNSFKIVNFSRGLMMILPIYLIIVFIPSIILMTLDLICYNSNGKGILMVVKKKA